MLAMLVHDVSHYTMWVAQRGLPSWTIIYGYTTWTNHMWLLNAVLLNVTDEISTMRNFLFMLGLHVA